MSGLKLEKRRRRLLLGTKLTRQVANEVFGPGFHPEKSLEVELNEGSSSNTFEKVNGAQRGRSGSGQEEPDPAALLTTNAGRHQEERRRTLVAAAGCLHALPTAGHRWIRGLHNRCPIAVAIPAAITHNSTRNSPRPPPSPVPAANHSTRSGRNGADLAVTAVAALGSSLDRPSTRRRGEPRRRRRCGRAALPAAA
ncbi:transcription factor EIL1-like protein [Oryza sativa Japonica Group]|uniref:Transcription factor EIL1-like protein n=1 Tax=Oryza sativa subsp. japonica TaxID=39947 RepID=Q8S123_ORYSJ|nr:transcription factor EIL1-like protein [Oryza sativa Japonica Group]